MINLLTLIMFSTFGRRAIYRTGRKLYQNARGDIPNDMASNGEMLVQECVVRALKGNALESQRMVVFDVGANIGDWSSALVRLLTKFAMKEVTDLYIFEPVPSTFTFLKSRLGTQNPNLHYVQAAISSENRESIIYVSEPNAGTNSLYGGSFGGDEQKITIEKVTISDFCKNNNLSQIHLLKCDTEGHDMEVIRGALPMLLDEKISVLQFEYNHRWIFARNYLRDAFMLIENLPYKLAMLQPDKLWVFSRWHPELERYFEGNFTLVHDDVLEWFPTKTVTWDCYNTMYVE